MTSIEFLETIGKEWAEVPTLTVSERKLARKLGGRDFDGSIGFPDGSIIEYLKAPKLPRWTHPGPRFEKTVREI